MQKTLTLLLVLLLPTLSIAQSAELERRHGFKDLRLGMIADSVKGAKLKKTFLEKKQFEASLYTVDHDDYKHIGEVDIDRVEIKTYKNHIYQIHVVTEKDPRLMKALESIYGLATYDRLREKYFWKAPSLTLTFRSYKKNQLEMIYTSHVVLKQVEADKKQKIVDIADDF